MLPLLVAAGQSAGDLAAPQCGPKRNVALACRADRSGRSSLAEAAKATGIPAAFAVRGGRRERQRTTMTGTLLCVSTFCVSLPSSNADTPRRPCEAITIASTFAFLAAARIASQGEAAIACAAVH